ncbi:MAG TPA: hypothetical protein VML75_29165 [Kofleriaceae bacterium]|nr:hypothetical protein [Kofleriaceae bacterium]
MATDSSNDDDRRSRWRVALGVAPAVLIALVAIWETVATVRAGSDIPGDAAWDRASAAVRAEHRPGDLIVFAPAWIDPVGRMHLGDLIPIEMAARMDAARYARIWELSIRGARSPDTRGLAPVSTTHVGDLTLRRFERQPAEVVTDFVAARPATSGARVELQEVGFEPRRCVVARPRAGESIEVRYPGVALGSRLVGYVGLADVFTRRDDRQPGQLTVVIDGAEVASVRAGVDDGWVRFEAPTTPAASAEVIFRASAGPRANKRLICFAAEARR